MTSIILVLLLCGSLSESLSESLSDINFNQLPDVSFNELVDLNNLDRDEFDEFRRNKASMFECFKQYDSIHNRYISNLVEDDVWFTNIFDSFDVCSNLELIWDDIDPSQEDELTVIIEDQEYFDSEIIHEIISFFNHDHDYLQRDDVKMDMAFHALRWLTQRKQIYLSVADFCNDDDDDRTQMIEAALLDITQKCVLHADILQDDEFDDELDDERRRMQDDDDGLDDNKISGLQEKCEDILKSHQAFAIEVTIQIGAVIHFSGGAGLYGQFEEITDFNIYKTFALGIVLNVELGVFISYIDFKYPNDFTDYMNARGQWTLGVQYYAGFAYSWIKNKNHGTIANKYNFAIGIGIQLVDYQWYIGNKEIKHIFDFNFTKLCNNKTLNDIKDALPNDGDNLPELRTSLPTQSPIKSGQPTPSPTSQPPSDSQINLFSNTYQSWWTPIETNNNGIWSNFTARSQISIDASSSASIDELNTNWIGYQKPYTLEWYNYTVSVGLKLSDDNVDAPSSVGVMFGASDIYTSYYFGVYYGTAIFGSFDKDGTFTLENEWPQPSIKEGKTITVATTIVNGNILLVFNDVILDTIITDEKQLRGSVGMRTIGKSATYTSFDIYFN